MDILETLILSVAKKDFLTFKENVDALLYSKVKDVILEEKKAGGIIVLEAKKEPEDDENEDEEDDEKKNHKEPDGDEIEEAYKEEDDDDEDDEKDLDEAVGIDNTTRKIYLKSNDKHIDFLKLMSAPSDAGKSETRDAIEIAHLSKDDPDRQFGDLTRKYRKKSKDIQNNNETLSQVQSLATNTQKVKNSKKVTNEEILEILNTVMEEVKK